MINGIKVPEEYEEFSFHSYEAIPLPTEHLKPFEILKLRDEKFNQYFERKEFLNRIKEKFGIEAVQNIREMIQIKLKRKLIDENHHS